MTTPTQNSSTPGENPVSPKRDAVACTEGEDSPLVKSLMSHFKEYDLETGEKLYIQSGGLCQLDSY